MVGVPPSCALLGGFAIGARVSLLWQHSANAKCQRVLVLAVCLVIIFTITQKLDGTDSNKRRMYSDLLANRLRAVVINLKSQNIFSKVDHETTLKLNIYSQIIIRSTSKLEN